MLESPLEAWCHDYKSYRMVFMAQMSLRTLETNSQELKMGSSVDDRSDYFGDLTTNTVHLIWVPRRTGLVPLPFGFFDYHIKRFHNYSQIMDTRG